MLTTVGMIIKHHHCNTSNIHLISFFENAECDHVDSSPVIMHSHDCCSHSASGDANDCSLESSSTASSGQLSIGMADCCIDYTQYISSDITTIIQIQEIIDISPRFTFLLKDISELFNPFTEISNHWELLLKLSDIPRHALIKSILLSTPRIYSSNSDSDPILF
jgi:hypothetical protein